jgi:hypothetical protein
MMMYSFSFAFPDARCRPSFFQEVSGVSVQVSGESLESWDAGMLESFEAGRLNRFELSSLIAFQLPGKMP